MKKYFSCLKFNENHFISHLSSRGLRLVCIEDDIYPDSLRHINDAPTCLFYKGDLGLAAKDTVSIVGGRKCTEQGKALAKKIARTLAENDYTVISGMAAGIDTAAHEGAIKAGNTVAILGCGLEICYPASNRNLFKIIEDRGCLISEYFWDEKPLKHHFPYRNRIISGISSAMIVIEAGQKSGAIITANLALEQGREVLAVPGNPGDQYSKGCNRLIKDGAFLLDDVDELSYFFNIGKIKKESVSTDPIIEAIAAKPKSLEELTVTLKSPAEKLFSRLTNLEVEQVIARDEKNRFFKLP